MINREVNLSGLASTDKNNLVIVVQEDASSSEDCFERNTFPFIDAGLSFVGVFFLSFSYESECILDNDIGHSGDIGAVIGEFQVGPLFVVIFYSNVDEKSALCDIFKALGFKIFWTNPFNRLLKSRLFHEVNELQFQFL